MALDERRISTRTKLKVTLPALALYDFSFVHSFAISVQESYLQAERQKAVMFATLTRVRQSLQDQGAQVFHRYNKAVGQSSIY